MLRRSVILGVMLAVTLVGCGGPPQPERELRWPPPPREPVIEWLGTISSSRDLKRSFFGRIKDFLFGKAADLFIGKPWGVTGDGKGRLYIADTARKGILVLDLHAGTARFYSSLGPHGVLREPVYVLVDSYDTIYVADTELKRVAVFSSDFAFQRFLAPEGEFVAPVGMAFDRREERLFVVDTRAHEVKVFGRDGRKLYSFGGRGDEQGQFHYPVTVAVSDGDTVYVVDSFHFAVQAFDLDGNFLFSFGPTRAGIGKMARPRDIALDSEGRVYVSDATRNNVQMYTAAGEFLMAFGEGGLGPGQFRLPAGLYIDRRSNRIYVADSINKRVQLFRYLTQR